MKLASSIRFGGQFIEAIDCDYESYSKYGLICPECKNSVFLVKGTTRNLGDRSIDIAPHFSHFKANKELGQICELRISNYTQANIDKAQSIARNQRLKFFQKWFWDCILSNQFLIDPGREISEIITIHDDLYATNLGYQKGMNSIYDAIKTCLKFEEERQNYIERFIATININDFDYRYNYEEKLPEHLSSLIEDIRLNVDLEMHKFICIEAVNFALTPRNRPRATSLLFNSFINIATRHGDNPIAAFDLNPDNMKCHLDNFIGMICLVSWARQFEAKTKNN